MTFHLINSDFFYSNINSDEDPDRETKTDLSHSDSTSDKPAFEVQFKSKEAVSQAEYFDIPIQRTVATH